MNRKQKVTAAAMTILTGIAIDCFFAFRYPYHLHFQETYQLFEWTGAYFAQVAWAPGGLADWLGRLLTQFFYYAPLGAALTAILLCAVQLLAWAACKQKTLITYALSFLPALLLVAFCCDENALMGSIVALALLLGVAALCQRIPSQKLRRALELILVPVLYLACGPLAIIYVIIIAFLELSGAGGISWREHFSARDTKYQSAAAQGARVYWVFIVILVLLAALCPLIASRIFPYPLERLLEGVHYYRFHNILPGMLYAAALAAVLVVLLSCLKLRRTLQSVIPAIALFVVLVAGGTFLMLRSADPVKEEWMRYDFMVRMQMWNRIMQAADQHNPDNPKTVSCLNLALAKTGRLPDSQFAYYQNGPDGLLPPYEGDYTNPVSTGEIFWHLGMVNTAQRYAFEAQEAIPDHQKSARFYQRLVETNLVNGDTLVAKKYLKALEHTTFYRSWARETATLLSEGTLFEKRPELARARAFRLREHDFLFSETEMDSMLGLLNTEHPENSLALDYLMAWCLLRKDLNRFAECIPLVNASPMPQVYQEALLLLWAFTHNDYNGLPTYISANNVQRMNRFMADANAGKSEAVMAASYGKTYWFYYLFRYLNRPE